MSILTMLFLKLIRYFFLELIEFMECGMYIHDLLFHSRTTRYFFMYGHFRTSLNQWREQKCLSWSQIVSDWLQKGHIWDFLRSVLVQFGSAS